MGLIKPCCRSGSALANIKRGLGYITSWLLALFTALSSLLASSGDLSYSGEVWNGLLILSGVSVTLWVFVHAYDIIRSAYKYDELLKRLDDE